ncbi:hypothetical protein QBC35DRAFT_56295 [Podospora australis]|uniref:Uncharacterized protein n=1 Tax=Podospora australis TaxID=1536484 RepID=A0AAN6WYP4_9PEZI|nr:hypothetical protein QBC35DRAFT_56295 [Podospora australis]
MGTDQAQPVKVIIGLFTHCPGPKRTNTLRFFQDRFCEMTKQKNKKRSRYLAVSPSHIHRCTHYLMLSLVASDRHRHRHKRTSFCVQYKPTPKQKSVSPIQPPGTISSRLKFHGQSVNYVVLSFLPPAIPCVAAVQVKHKRPCVRQVRALRFVYPIPTAHEHAGLAVCLSINQVMQEEREIVFCRTPVIQKHRNRAAGIALVILVKGDEIMSFVVRG